MSNEKEYWLFFDTNVLFQLYDKKADFNSFSFNSTFENVCDMLSQLDIYERVSVGIPKVVWNEMTQQIIEAHATRVLELDHILRNGNSQNTELLHAILKTTPIISNQLLKGTKKNLKRALSKSPNYLCQVHQGFKV